MPKTFHNFKGGEGYSKMPEADKVSPRDRGKYMGIVIRDIENDPKISADQKEGYANTWLATIHAESEFNPITTNPESTEYGAAQMNEPTAKDYKIPKDNFFDIDVRKNAENTRAKDIIRKFGLDLNNPDDQDKFYYYWKKGINKNLDEFEEFKKTDPGFKNFNTGKEYFADPQNREADKITKVPKIGGDAGILETDRVDPNKSSTGHIPGLNNEDFPQNPRSVRPKKSTIQEAPPGLRGDPQRPLQFPEGDARNNPSMSDDGSPYVPRNPNYFDGAAKTGISEPKKDGRAENQTHPPQSNTEPAQTNTSTKNKSFVSPALQQAHQEMQGLGFNNLDDLNYHAKRSMGELVMLDDWNEKQQGFHQRDKARDFLEKIKAQGLDNNALITMEYRTDKAFDFNNPDYGNPKPGMVQTMEYKPSERTFDLQNVLYPKHKDRERERDSWTRSQDRDKEAPSSNPDQALLKKPHTILPKRDKNEIFDFGPLSKGPLKNEPSTEDENNTQRKTIPFDENPLDLKLHLQNSSEKYRNLNDDDIIQPGRSNSEIVDLWRKRADARQSKELSSPLDLTPILPTAKITSENADDGSTQAKYFHALEDPQIADASEQERNYYANLSDEEVFQLGDMKSIRNGWKLRAQANKSRKSLNSGWNA